MRTIKFRCWDEENKKMWPYAAPLLGRNNINVSCQENGGFNDFVKGVLLQFTGLHDVDGKEIFEGDIFQHPDKKCFVVIYDAPSLSFQAKYSDGDITSIPMQINPERGAAVLVGNIFETPELLNGG